MPLIHLSRPKDTLSNFLQYEILIKVFRVNLQVNFSVKHNHLQKLQIHNIKC